MMESIVPSIARILAHRTLHNNNPIPRYCYTLDLNDRKWLLSFAIADSRCIGGKLSKHEVNPDLRFTNLRAVFRGHSGTFLTFVRRDRNQIFLADSSDRISAPQYKDQQTTSNHPPCPPHSPRLDREVRQHTNPSRLSLPELISLHDHDQRS